MSRAQEILDRLELFGIRLALDTTRPLLAALDNPQSGLPTVLVAGTNGKGSTATLLASMVSAAGYRVGLYTSPHLEVVEERLRIDGVPISEEELGEVLDRVVRAGETVLDAPPTYFEALTAAAWCWFSDQRVDLAVMEVGMGGRLDATNAGEPLLSLITPIGLDHTAHLGDTLGQIAGEKAGILRAAAPAIVWPGSDEAQRAIAAAGQELGARITWAPEALTRIDRAPRGLAGQRVELETPEATYGVDLALSGQHQAQNLGQAILAAEELARLGFSRLTATAMQRGAEGCRWPGRLEHILCPPPRSGRELLLDAAHNPAGIQSLLRFLRETLELAQRPFDLLFGAFANKDAENMLRPIAAAARHVVLTAPQGRKPHPPATLAQWVEGEPTLAETAGEGLDLALEGEGLLVVTGSLYLAGEARTLLRERLGVPASPYQSIFQPSAAEVAV